MSSPAASWTGRGDAVATRVLLLRHGQSPMSVERRYSGRGDPELTETGLAQAAAAATSLGAREVDVVVCSPLARARQTAIAAAAQHGLDVTVDERLTETDFGAWEGLTFAEASSRDPEVHRAWLTDTSLAPPDGESFDAVAVRVQAALDDLLATHAGRTVLLVSHVTPIKQILRAALDAGPAMLYRLHLDLASLSTIDFWPDGGASVRLVNDTCHLG